MLADVINSAWDLSNICYIVLSMFTFVPHGSYDCKTIAVVQDVTSGNEGGGRQ